MKIGLICPYNIFKNGGVQECVLALQAEYTRKGHQSLILTPRPIGVETENFDGIRLIGASRDFKSPFHTTAQVSVSFDNTAINTLLDENQFDILHFHEPWVPIVSRQILTRSTAVNIATFHAKLPETMMSKTIERVVTPYTRSILKYIDEFTAVSDAAAEYLQSIYEGHIDIIPNGIDLDKFKITQKKRDKHTILYIGRLEKRKGVKYLLDAFALLKNDFKGAKLIIAGDGPDREKLETYARDLKLRDISFLGFVDDHTKVRLLHEATVFCSPALYGESFGIVLLEAMAAGAVTVAANNPGYASVMQDKGAISLVYVKEADNLARRLKLLMSDTDMRKLWLDWSQEYVQQFNYERIASLYLNVYTQAIRRHKA